MQVGWLLVASFLLMRMHARLGISHGVSSRYSVCMYLLTFMAAPQIIPIVYPHSRQAMAYISG